MAKYLITREFWREQNAIPSASLSGAELHRAPQYDNGVKNYGWIETYEPLPDADVKLYALEERQTNDGIRDH